MARIDLGAIQQRLAQQQPPPVPAEPPSWLTRPAPASALRTTPPKPRLATASAAAPAGTLRATTTMRTALSFEATDARAVRAEERARVSALRAQIEELNAELVAVRAEAARALAQEQARGDQLGAQIESGRRDLEAARAEADRAAERAERALTGERQRADALRERLEQAQAALAAVQHDAQAAQQAATELRRAWKGRGVLGRLRAALRGEIAGPKSRG